MSSQSVGRLARKQKAPDTLATISCRGDSRIALGGVVITEQAGDTNHHPLATTVALGLVPSKRQPAVVAFPGIAQPLPSLRHPTFVIGTRIGGYRRIAPQFVIRTKMRLRRLRARR